MGTIFSTFPSATSTIASVAAWAGPWLGEFVLWAALIIGVILAGMAASKLISLVTGSARKVLGTRRGSRRRRR